MTKDGVSINTLRKKATTSPVIPPSAALVVPANIRPSANLPYMLPPAPMNAISTRNSHFFRNKLSEKTAATPVSLKRPPSQVLPARVPPGHWKKDMVDLTSPEAVVLTDDLPDDDPVIEESIGTKVQQRKTRMRLSARRKMKNLKKDVTNGQASDEQKSELKQQTAVHRFLTYDTPRKSVDRLVEDSIIGEESTQEAMDFLILEKQLE